MANVQNLTLIPNRKNEPFTITKPGTPESNYYLKLQAEEKAQVSTGFGTTSVTRTRTYYMFVPAVAADGSTIEPPKVGDTHPIDLDQFDIVDRTEFTFTNEDGEVVTPVLKTLFPKR